MAMPMRAYRVERVENSTEMEALLNSAWAQGYRYRDGIPISGQGNLGHGSRTERLFVVLEHVDVARALGSSPGVDGI